MPAIAAYSVIAALGQFGTFGAAHAVTVFDAGHVQIDMYGVLDAGIGYLQHSYAASDVLASTVNSYNLNSSPHSFTGLYSGGVSMSRVGLKGEAAFDSGQKLFFKLESAINVTSGVLSNNGQAIDDNISKLRTANSASAVNGQTFARAAYVGLSDPKWGSLEVGRTPNFALDQVVEYDPLQAALLFSPVGYSGAIGGGLGATENSRLDTSGRYENRLGPVSIGAQYKFAGSDHTQAAGRGWVAMLGYDAGRLSVKGTYSETTNTVSWPVQYSNVVAPNAYVQVENTKGYLLAALYRIGNATLKVGWEDLTISAPSNPNLDVQDYFGLILPKPSQNAVGQQRISLYWAGGDYRFSPSFDIAAAFYNIDNYDSPEVGKAYWATAYSLLADYNVSRSFDVYVGIMEMQYRGIGLVKRAPVDAFSSNGMYGVGARYRF